MLRWQRNCLLKYRRFKVFTTFDEYIVYTPNHISVLGLHTQANDVRTRSLHGSSLSKLIEFNRVFGSNFHKLNSALSDSFEKFHYKFLQAQKSWQLRAHMVGKTFHVPLKFCILLHQLVASLPFTIDSIINDKLMEKWWGRETEKKRRRDGETGKERDQPQYNQSILSGKVYSFNSFESSRNKFPKMLTPNSSLISIESICPFHGSRSFDFDEWILPCNVMPTFLQSQFSSTDELHMDIRLT